jgi:hypothetical protein
MAGWQPRPRGVGCWEPHLHKQACSPVSGRRMLGAPPSMASLQPRPRGVGCWERHLRQQAGSAVLGASDAGSATFISKLAAPSRGVGREEPRPAAVRRVRPPRDGAGSTNLRVRFNSELAPPSSARAPSRSVGRQEPSPAEDPPRPSAPGTVVMAAGGRCQESRVSSRRPTLATASPSATTEDGSAQSVRSMCAPLVS